MSRPKARRTFWWKYIKCYTEDRTDTRETEKEVSTSPPVPAPFQVPVPPPPRDWIRRPTLESHQGPFHPLISQLQILFHLPIFRQLISHHSDNRFISGLRSQFGIMQLTKSNVLAVDLFTLTFGWTRERMLAHDDYHVFFRAFLAHVRVFLPDTNRFFMTTYGIVSNSRQSAQRAVTDFVFRPAKPSSLSDLFHDFFSHGIESVTFAPILIVHLPRVDTDPAQRRRVSYRSPITYSMRLDLTKYAPAAVFSLYAVVCLDWCVTFVRPEGGAAWSRRVHQSRPSAANADDVLVHRDTVQLLVYVRTCDAAAVFVPVPDDSLPVIRSLEKDGRPFDTDFTECEVTLYDDASPRANAAIGVFGVSYALLPPRRLRFSNEGISNGQDLYDAIGKCIGADPAGFVLRLFDGSPTTRIVREKSEYRSTLAYLSLFLDRFGAADDEWVDQVRASTFFYCAELPMPIQFAGVVNENLDKPYHLLRGPVASRLGLPVGDLDVFDVSSGAPVRVGAAAPLVMTSVTVAFTLRDGAKLPQTPTKWQLRPTDVPIEHPNSRAPALDVPFAVFPGLSLEGYGRAKSVFLYDYHCSPGDKPLQLVRVPCDAPRGDVLAFVRTVAGIEWRPERDTFLVYSRPFFDHHSWELALRESDFEFGQMALRFEGGIPQRRSGELMNAIGIFSEDGWVVNRRQVRFLERRLSVAEIARRFTESGLLPQGREFVVSLIGGKTDKTCRRISDLSLVVNEREVRLRFDIDHKKERHLGSGERLVPVSFMDLPGVFLGDPFYFILADNELVSGVFDRLRSVLQFDESALENCALRFVYGEQTDDEPFAEFTSSVHSSIHSSSSLIPGRQLRLQVVRRPVEYPEPLPVVFE
jgi:hypothetical protein